MCAPGGSELPKEKKTKVCTESWSLGPQTCACSSIICPSIHTQLCPCVCLSIYPNGCLSMLCWLGEGCRVCCGTLWTVSPWG